MYKSALILVLLLSSWAQADESSISTDSVSTSSSSSSKLNDFVPLSNTVPDADVADEILTNPNLRAYSGSKSRWSMSNTVTYNGGTIGAPLAEARPNIGTASGVSTDTDLNDQISAKYSIDAVDAILAGFGVRKMAPFTGHGPSSAFYTEGGKDVDIYDPSLTYQRIYKFLGIQSVAQVQVIQFTREDIHSPKFGNLNRIYQFDQENIYEIGRFSIGGSIGFGGATPTDPDVDYSRYQFWANPYVEYRISPTYRFRTVANTWNYEYYANEKTFQMDAYTQSIGIGCSLRRDFYLFPNIQFVPNHIASSFTNVGLTATINVF